MAQDTFNILVSGLMGLIGGLITLPINAVISLLLKKEELNLQSKLKHREMQLQAKIDIDKEKELQRLRSTPNLQSEISSIKSRIEKLEKDVNGEMQNGI